MIATHSSDFRMSHFSAFGDIVSLWKSAAEAGRALGVKPGTMRAYAAGLRRFPVERIVDLVAAARARPGGEIVTHELVCRLIAGSASSTALKSEPKDAPATGAKWANFDDAAA